MGTVVTWFRDHEEDRPLHAALVAALPEERVVTAAGLLAEGNAASADVAVVTAPTPGALAPFTGLRLIQSLWAGVDKLLTDGDLPPGATIARLVDPDMAVSMAETVVAHVLAIHKDHPHYARAQADGLWDPRPTPNASERRIGFLGLGHLSKAAATRLAPFGFPIAGWSRSGAPVTGVTVHTGRDGLLALVAQSDILVNLLPLTPETTGIVDATLLAAMKPDAALVNLGRGAHVVEEDLLAALDAGRPAEAVLDVFRTEPLPAGHPFWTHPRVRVFPHVAARTSKETAIALAAAAVRRLRAGQPARDVVERGRGY